MECPTPYQFLLVSSPNSLGPGPSRLRHVGPGHLTSEPKSPYGPPNRGSRSFHVGGGPYRGRDGVVAIGWERVRDRNGHKRVSCNAPPWTAGPTEGHEQAPAKRDSPLMSPRLWYDGNFPLQLVFFYFGSPVSILTSYWSSPNKRKKKETQNTNRKRQTIFRLNYSFTPLHMVISIWLFNH